MSKYADDRIAHPAKFYANAEAVTNDAGLTPEEKQRVLDSMALDADLLSEATEEGMAGGEQPFSVEGIHAARQNVLTSAQSRPGEGFKSIVVALTGDMETDEKIARYAFMMAPNDAEVHIVNVIEPDEGLIQTAAGPHMGAPHIGMEIDQQRLEEEHAKRQSINEGIRREWGADVSGEDVIAHGEPSAQITGFAKDKQAELIVIGTGDRSWFEKFLGIAPMQDVAETAPCPILIIPPFQPFIRKRPEV